MYGPSESVHSNAFPKGYGAFYCMKHEISQDQYASYLNHLGTWEAILRFPDYTGSYRYTISLASNKYVATAPDRACNYLSVLDMCNYLDWACLRPMTELEYEKACRGPLTPEPNEYAWGSTTISYLTSVNGTDGSGTETALPATANCHAVSVVSGPVRVGIFAVPGADRQKSGAGYYGVLDLIGNVAELAVASGSTGNTYIPNHGDGSTSALPEGWPSYLGFTYRGGSFGDSEMASSRGNTAGSSRDNHCGGRGVRSVQ
jgi:formylglycine-generating enzyme required for sulfatase activity